MSQAPAAPANVAAINTAKQRFKSIKDTYISNGNNINIYDANLKRYLGLSQWNKQNNEQTVSYELIRSSINDLVGATSLLKKITELSKTIAANLNEVRQLKTDWDHLHIKSYDVPIGDNVPLRRVTIGEDGGVTVDALSTQSVADNHHLNTTSSVELNRPPPVLGSGSVSLGRWVGGSKTAQVGGRAAYSLPFSSHLYVKAVTELKPLTPENNPTFYKELKEAILDKTIQPVLATTTKNESSSASHDTPLSPAAQSANNPNVIKNLIMNLKAKTEESQTSIIKKYEDLVMMCDKTTALELIKPLLKPKKGETIPTDKKLLTMLGWNGNDNELLYDINKRRKGGGGVFIQGLFSFFCFDNDKFSVGFSRHCGRNYVCMLNWVIIVAFRLQIRDPDIYTDALIITLIENMHNALCSNLDNFTKNTSDNAGLYIVGAKTSMNRRIFNYEYLKVLVEGIKSEVQKIPEPSSSGGSYHNTTHKLSHKNVKGGNKVTTRKHRRPTIHNVGHTVKVAQKPTDVNTIKTSLREVCDNFE
jgi:hypothetical protein